MPDGAAQRLQNLQLIVGKGVCSPVINGENANDIAANDEWNADCRTRVQLTSDVIRIAIDVLSIVHPSGSGNVTDHALKANLQTGALFILGATTHPLKNHLVGSGITQPDRHFNAAERGSKVVHHALQQSIQIQRRGDELRGTLQFH